MLESDRQEISYYYTCIYHFGRHDIRIVQGPAGPRRSPEPQTLKLHNQFSVRSVQLYAPSWPVQEYGGQQRNTGTQHTQSRINQSFSDLQANPQSSVYILYSVTVPNALRLFTAVFYIGFGLQHLTMFTKAPNRVNVK